MIGVLENLFKIYNIMPVSRIGCSACQKLAKNFSDRKFSSRCSIILFIVLIFSPSLAPAKVVYLDEIFLNAYIYCQIKKCCNDNRLL